MDIYITGASATRFGELWTSSPRSLSRTAVFDAISDAGIEKDQVDAIYVGNMLSGILGNQEHLGAFFAEELGLHHVPAYKIEGACASGGLAAHLAIQSVRSGVNRTVVVLGIEKMTDHKPEDVARALTGAGSESERISGVTFPGLYAMLARAHMNEYQTTERQMASVAVKNHYHGTLNPKAQFRTNLTIEKVLASSMIADPLKLYDCSPISDGAAAVVIQRDDVMSQSMKKKSVTVVASTVATDTLGLSTRESLLELASTRIASTLAYKEAAISPRDIDVAEVHDCFSIAEIYAMEDLGFYPKGKAGPALERGETHLSTSKKLVVNTSGGLKACGHPVGATGVKQLVEIADQLRGRVGERQVKHARIGLTHNVGGSGATAVVHILKKKE